MAIAYFASLPEADTLEIKFLKPSGGEMTCRLLVDSGFTGQSCFVTVHPSPPVIRGRGAGVRG